MRKSIVIKTLLSKVSLPFFFLFWTMCCRRSKEILNISPSLEIKVFMKYQKVGFRVKPFIPINTPGAKKAADLTLLKAFVAHHLVVKGESI